MSNRARTGARRKAAAAPTVPTQPAPADAADFAASIKALARRIRRPGSDPGQCRRAGAHQPGDVEPLETGRVSPSLRPLWHWPKCWAFGRHYCCRRWATTRAMRSMCLTDRDSRWSAGEPSGVTPYHLLAAQRGPRKVFEPFLVTLTDKSEIFPGFQHAGTEFIYILSGEIRYRHGKESFLPRARGTRSPSAGMWRMGRKGW